jgi:hypothetical protein
MIYADGDDPLYCVILYSMGLEPNSQEAYGRVIVKNSNNAVDGAYLMRTVIMTAI